MLLLLLAVTASGFIARLGPARLPLPLVQVAIGAAIALFTDFEVDLAPSIFFLLLLPPLLFVDGWRMPREGWRRDGRTILEMALGLVVFTVVGLGLFIHWMLPTVPLAAAFAIAAVLSPTDPVAVAAIASRMQAPKRMLTILEGESLLNDASALVCLRFAVAAVVTGAFSFFGALGSLVWVTLGGLASGVLVTLAVAQYKTWFGRRFGEEPGLEIIVSLLIPFGAYLLAEAVHASGILAAVAAGVMMSLVEARGQAMATTRVRRAVVWDTIQFAAHGVIFVLLGEQMPSILARAGETVKLAGQSNPLWLGVYVLAIIAVLTALRFVWITITLQLSLRRARRRGEPAGRPRWRLVAAMSVAGVRGAITLAGVLTIPFFTDAGAPFPARNLAIFLAAGVILGTLVLASIALPLLLKGLTMPADGDEAEQEDRARASAATAALRAVEGLHHRLAREALGKGRADADLYAEAAARIMDVYRRRIEAHGLSSDEGDARQRDAIEQRLRLAALNAEREEIFRLARLRQVGDETARRLVREIDLLEARYRT